MSDIVIHHRRRRAARFVALTVAGVLAAVGVQLVSSDAANAAAGDAQLLVIANNSANIEHTIRSASGSWSGFGNVENVAGELGLLPDTAGVVISGMLHVLAVSRDNGHLYHATRNGDGSWTGFIDVFDRAGSVGRVVSVSAAAVGGLLHVVLRNLDGNLFHTILFADGSWQPFGNIKLTTAGDPGFVTDVAAVGFTNTLQLAVSTLDGGLFHTIRFGDGSWQKFADVQLAANGPFDVTRVSAAGTGGNFQLLAVTSEGGLFHAVRTPSGNWQSFGNVKGPAGDPGPVVDVAATGLSTGQAQVVVAVNGGGIFHAIRSADGSWQPFRDVTQPAGNPGPVTRVSIAGA